MNKSAIDVHEKPLSPTAGDLLTLTDSATKESNRRKAQALEDQHRPTSGSKKFNLSCVEGLGKHALVDNAAESDESSMFVLAEEGSSASGKNQALLSNAMPASPPNINRQDMDSPKKSKHKRRQTMSGVELETGRGRNKEPPVSRNRSTSDSGGQRRTTKDKQDRSRSRHKKSHSTKDAIHSMNMSMQELRGPAKEKFLDRLSRSVEDMDASDGVQKTRKSSRGRHKESPMEQRRSNSERTRPRSSGGSLDRSTSTDKMSRVAKDILDSLGKSVQNMDASLLTDGDRRTRKSSRGRHKESPMEHSCSKSERARPRSSGGSLDRSRRNYKMSRATNDILDSLGKSVQDMDASLQMDSVRQIRRSSHDRQKEGAMQRRRSMSEGGGRLAPVDLDSSSSRSKDNMSRSAKGVLRLSKSMHNMDVSLPNDGDRRTRKSSRGRHKEGPTEKKRSTSESGRPRSAGNSVDRSRSRSADKMSHVAKDVLASLGKSVQDMDGVRKTRKSSRGRKKEAPMQRRSSMSESGGPRLTPGGLDTSRSRSRHKKKQSPKNVLDSSNVSMHDMDVSLQMDSVRKTRKPSQGRRNEAPVQRRRSMSQSEAPRSARDNLDRSNSRSRHKMRHSANDAPDTLSKSVQELDVSLQMDGVRKTRKSSRGRHKEAPMERRRSNSDGGGPKLAQDKIDRSNSRNRHKMRHSANDAPDSVSRSMQDLGYATKDVLETLSKSVHDMDASSQRNQARRARRSSSGGFAIEADRGRPKEEAPFERKRSSSDNGAKRSVRASLAQFRQSHNRRRQKQDMMDSSHRRRNLSARRCESHPEGGLPKPSTMSQRVQSLSESVQGGVPKPSSISQRAQSVAGDGSHDNTAGDVVTKKTTTRRQRRASRDRAVTKYQLLQALQMDEE